MLSLSNIAVAITLFVGSNFLNSMATASETREWESWAGTYSCEDCGPKGSSTADGKGPTPCWEYTIKVQKPDSKFGQGKAEIQINGFQTSDDFSSQAVVEGNNLDLFLLPKDGTPLVHLFKMKKDRGPRLLFRGIESNTNRAEISCAKK